MTRDEMDEVTNNCPTKSAKIRILSDRGVSRAEIANYLNIRYQHVRNVLVAPVPAAKQASSPKTTELAAKTIIETNLARAIEQAKLDLAARLGVAMSNIEINIKF